VPTANIAAPVGAELVATLPSLAEAFVPAVSEDRNEVRQQSLNAGARGIK
jgi:hypothetical protein